MLEHHFTMETPPVTFVLVLLGLIAILAGPLVQVEGSRALDEETSAITTTKLDTRFNRTDSRLDRIETAIADMNLMMKECICRKDNKQDEKPKVYGGCQDALAHGLTYSGVYTIADDGDNLTRDVFCEQRLDGGGWTVFQARYNGSVDFFNDWDTYKTGFGDLRGEFWLGNENIHQLTKHHNQQLKIELTAPDGEVQHADYVQFYVASESDKFRLTVTGYSGGSLPGNSMGYQNGHRFSTKDHDNDVSSSSCANKFLGGWWYAKCHSSNLNGQYGNVEYGKGLNWRTWKGLYGSMKATRMMIRERS